MDPLLRDNMFVGLSLLEIAEAVICELRRRRYYGCLYAFSADMGPAAFASSTPEGSMRDMSSAEQLNVFAEVAGMAVNETKTFVDTTKDDAPRRPN